MSDYENLSPFKIGRKYDVVFISKFRKKQFLGEIRGYLEKVSHELTWQKESKIMEGHLMLDHVHMCVSISPKYSVAQVIGFQA